MHPKKLLLAMAVATIFSASQRAHAVTIAASKLAADNTEVTVDNVVISNTIDLINSAGSANFHVQDATGGVTVFGTAAVIAAALTGVNAGDVVTITGTTDSFNGLYELVAPLTVVLVTDEAGVPAPLATTTPDYQNLSGTAEFYESQLVKLPSVQFTGLVPGQMFASGVNYTVTDGVLNAIARISNSAQSLVGDVIPTGPVRLTGIHSQFDSANPLPGVAGNGYQLLLLDDSSVIPIPEPTSGTLFMLAIVGLVRRFVRRRAR
jgi:hypothetical protein